MSTEFKLPSLGEGVKSADVAELRIKAGDRVEAEQIVAELETEKAVVELPCPVAGTVEQVHVSQGSTINVGDLFLTINEAAEAKSNGSAASPAAPAGETAPSAEGKPEKAAAGKKVSAEPPPPAAASQPGRKASPRQEKPAKTGGSSSKAAAGQKIDFQLPAIGEGVEAADVAEVHVKAGDTIQADQTVMDLETEKAVIELPCPFAGTIETINVAAGDTVKVGQTLFTLRSVSGDLPAQPPPAPAPKAAQPAAKPAPPPRRAEAELVDKPAAPRPAAPATTAAAPQSHKSREAATHSDGGSPVPAAPSTRRLARQLGVDLRSVKGRGPGGRITHEDVQAYVKGRLQSASVPALRREGGGGMSMGALAPPPLPDFSRFGKVDREKLNKLGRTAAENLTVSWNVIPHVTQHDRADVTELEAARKRFGARLGDKSPKITMTAIAIKALATCLQAFPKFNSSLDPETFELVLKRYYHIGCAVDTPHGLLVPVVRDADQKSILHIASELAELAAQARDRKLSMDAMQGATCTLTNLGGIGGVAFTPIVNYPEVCILGMSRTQTELRLDDGKVTERLMLPLALSYDHRVINGADAARFVAALCNMLSDPFQLLSAI